MGLRRQLHLVPEASSGPPEWDIEVTSGRERATIYADLAGRITHANFDGTRRAQSLNYLNGGAELDAVVATIADVLGKQPTIKSVIVYDHSLAFEALNPDHPDRFSRFSAGLNGVYRDLLLDTAANMNIPNQPAPADSSRSPMSTGRCCPSWSRRRATGCSFRAERSGSSG